MKNFIITVILFCLLVLQSNRIYSQINHDTVSAKDTIPYIDTTLSKEEDVMDIIGKIFKRKISETPDSLKIKPGKLLLSVLPGMGYTLATGIAVVSSINVSFYTGKKHNTYLSSLLFVPEFPLFKPQIVLPVQLNLWTDKNKYNWLGDWRYYKYPTYTYGLGGHSRLSNADLIDYSYIRAYQEVLKKIHRNFFAGFGYNLDYHYNIKEKGTGDFQEYNNNKTTTISSGVTFHLLYDGRINVNNPPRGSYISITYRSNSTLFGSDNNWQSLLVDMRKYIKLSPRSENVLALWSYSWFTFGGKPPYFDLPSTGWDTYSNIGRGYIQSRLRGTNFLYTEAEYRFKITRNGLLGGVVFANAESVSEIQSNKFETVLPGGGLGLRFKVNKHSRANFCIDYGVGTQGSRGFFFTLCEIF